MIDLLNEIIKCENDPIVNIQYLDSEYPPERAQNALVIDKLSNLSFEKRKEIYNEFNIKDDNNSNNEQAIKDDHNSDNDQANNPITNPNTNSDNKKKRKNNNNFYESVNKTVKKNIFEGKAIRLDSLISTTRERETKEKNDISILSFKNDNNNTSFFAVTKTKELINVEIQVQNTDNMYKRSLFYASDIIYHSLPKSKNYIEIPNTILIIFLHYDITKNENKFHWCFTFHDKETKTEEGFEGILDIHLIELSKFERLYNNGQLNENNHWYLFLIDPNNDYFLNNETPVKFIQARETLLSLEGNDKYIKVCEKEEELFNDYLNGLNNQKIEGFIEGNKEGKIINKIITTIKLIQNGNDIKFIKSLTNFNDSQITEINNFLKQTDYSIERLATIFEVDINILIKEFKNEYKSS
jgi:predicted transposase/invertase (TIGR01784 family)